MKRIYAGMAMWAMIFLIGTMVLGLMIHKPGSVRMGWHIQVALGTAVGIILIHSVIFVHLLGTGLGVKRAVFEHKIPDEPIVQALWKMKMTAYPPAFFCMAVTIMVAVGGGAVQTGGLDPIIHRYMSIALLVVNLITIPIEIKVINQNTDLIRQVENIIEAKSGPSTDSVSASQAERTQA
jgi:hypothetical protein